MRLVINDKALADIGGIHRWIAVDSPTAAARTIVRLFESIETLAIFPELGHAGLDPGTMEWIVPRTPYLVVYEIKPVLDELLVLAVFHQAQQRTPGAG